MSATAGYGTEELEEREEERRARVDAGLADLLTDADEPLEEGTGKHALVRDRYDEAVYGFAAGEYPRLQSGEIAAKEKLSTSGELLRDVYAAFHQRAPLLVPPERLTNAHRVNREIVEEVMATDQYRELREGGTVNDDLNAAIATIVVGEALVERLNTAERELINELDAAEEQANQLDELGDMLDEQVASTGDGALAQRGKRVRARGQQARARASELAARLENHGQARRDAMRRQARKAMEEAKQQLADVQAASEAFGGPGQGPGEGLVSMPLKEKIELAKRVRKNPKLGKLAGMIGRLRSLAAALQAAKVDHAASEVTDVTIGDDLPYVLPDELGVLGDDDLELAFYAAYTDASLLQYRLHGEDKVGRGPIICAIDESGSMRSHMPSEYGEGVTREEWSKAVALALLAVAKQQRRDMAIIHFGSNDELRTDIFPKGRATPRHLVEVAEHFFNGGTEYEGWMGASLDLIKGSQFDKADVILLSDGEAHVDDAMALAWEQAKRSKRFRTYAVLIASRYGDGEYGGGVLDRIAEAVIPIAGLAGERRSLERILSV